jgi:dTMP kinase
MRGLFITFEGVEGSGKSSQCRLLAQWLREEGHQVRETSEPDGTTLGERIRSFFEDPAIRPAPLTELFLFLAARQQHVTDVILPALEAGMIVLSDRYADATLAYQGYGRRLDRHTIGELNALATGGITPDLTILLDLDPAVGLGRLGNRKLDRFEQLDLAFHRRVRDGYLEIARVEKQRFIVIDGNLPEARIQDEIRHAVSDRLARGNADV